MSILIKKIGKKEYAYLAYRSGAKVIHKYLGPAAAQSVDAKKGALRVEKGVPKKYHAFFWDTDAGQLHLKAHARYIIERVLEFGDMEAFQWLQKVYSGREICLVLETGRKLSPKSRKFWEVWYEFHTAH